MDIQRLRNLTTGRLHTEIGHVYQDIEFFTGERGVMTHMLPRACRALDSYLREVLADNPRLFDGAYDVTHVGEIEMQPMGAEERAAFWERYRAQPDPLVGKAVIAVQA